MRPLVLGSVLSLILSVSTANGETTHPKDAYPAAKSDLQERLKVQMVEAAAEAKGRVGAAVGVLGTDAVVAIFGDERLPMQSVFKLPLAMTVLNAVDRGVLQLHQTVQVRPADFVSMRQHSPIRDQNPKGVTLSVSALLRSAAGESDGTAADVLLGQVGGPNAVTQYVHGLGVRDLNVSKTEKEMGSDPKATFQNWATPKGALALLRALDEGRGLSQESRQHLLRVLTETPTGPKRIKGELPAGTSVAHKTGSSRTIDGITAATNDIGIITLPNGKRVAVVVFVSDSPADDATREQVIAKIAKAAYDYAVQIR